VDDLAEPISCSIKFVETQKTAVVAAMYLKRRLDPYTEHDPYGARQRQQKVQAPPPTDEDAFYGPNSGRAPRDNDSSTPPPGKTEYRISGMY